MNPKYTFFTSKAILKLRCCPVFVPQITGGARPVIRSSNGYCQNWCPPFLQGLDTAKVSVWHSPRLFPVPALAVGVGPIVMVVTVTGLLSTKLSKSSLKLFSY